jgi:SAM-dependent methyltransferase
VDIRDLIPAIPWRPWEGRLPWDDPAFSERMLAEHLSQDHDLASRRSEQIDRHAAWLHSLVGERPTRVLDLGCGPGLYTSRLAALGHECVGVDFAPAAIGYARTEARRRGLACEYRLENVLSADVESGFGLVTLLFGDLDTLPLSDAERVLEKMAGTLGPGGVGVIEVHTRVAVYRMGTGAHGRRALAAGLFAPRPHVLLEESNWLPDAQIGQRRFWVVDAATANVRMHSVTTQARDYRPVLEGMHLDVADHPLGADPWIGDAFRVLTFRR